MDGLKRGVVVPPINVEIDLSNRCSLSCEWCHFGFTHTKGPLAGKRDKPSGAIPGGDLMDTALAKSIVDQLAEAGVKSVTWTGGGEPTLHPDFNEIVTYTADLLEQGLYTHGGHIDEGRAALLKEALTFVYVSLDAADPFSYKRDKGVDRFQAACDGISRLAKARGHAKIGVGYLITPDNWRSADHATTLVHKLGADYIQFRPTILYNQETPDQLAEDPSWLDPVIPWLERLQKRFPSIEVDLERFDRYRNWTGHGYATCWWSGLQSVITPNGKVWTCVNKREHAGALVGDLSVDSWEQVWGRRTLHTVGHDCRLLCRGDVANRTLDVVLPPRPHSAFP